MKLVASERRRFEYRRIHVILGRQGRDLRQGGVRCEAMQETGAGGHLADALHEVWGRGSFWRSAITTGSDAAQRHYQPAALRTWGILPTDKIEKSPSLLREANA
ncbi:hypothetical protein A6U94_26600 [Agrobacterium tumefaciens]|jgi:hypothetical protein|nr:hypothetical protein A6U94_26600 [Agrobacterium tumefaciens]